MNHKLNDTEKIQSQIDEVIKAGGQFSDNDFNIADADNAGDNHARIAEQTVDFSFMSKKGDLAYFANQGGIGNSWFLTALSILAQKRVGPFCAESY